MLRHIIMLKWSPESTPDQRRAAEDGLRALPARIDAIRALTAGPDAGLTPGAYDCALVADFDDVDGWRAYQEHPAHRALVADVLAPIIAERAVVQLDV
ncbi:Dabb family protein [Actinomadura nitritigenes]|uniref:Dabb family protein n=1 Tax=Actinomadura nitritigenes TaxID=134602 RepID=UPI003D8FAB79